MNPYLWIFCAAFSTAKFFAWIFQPVHDDILKRMHEKEKVRKVMMWLCLAVVSFFFVVLFFQQRPFPVNWGIIFFLILFFGLFLLWIFPRIFVFPMIGVLFILSLIFVDLRTSYVQTNEAVLRGQPLFRSFVSGRNRQEYHFETASQELEMPLDLVVDLPSLLTTVKVEILEVHALPIWFFWWTSNYFYINRILDTSGQVLWENTTISPVLKYLVGRQWGWLSKKDTLTVNLQSPALIYWHAYNWSVKYESE